MPRVDERSFRITAHRRRAGKIEIEVVGIEEACRIGGLAKRFRRAPTSVGLFPSLGFPTGCAVKASPFP